MILGFIVMTGFNRNIIVWSFNLDRWKKKLLQVTFDALIASSMLLLAYLMRLETTYFLYHLDTYIGVFIAGVTTPVVFAMLGLYNIN